MKKKISILGSTGSVGLSTLKIIDKKKDYFKINILAAKENYSLICKQIKKYQPKIFIISNKKIFEKVKNNFKRNKILILNNFDQKKLKKSDLTVSAIPGIAGLHPTISLIRISKKILLANKESIICGWNLIKKTASRYNSKVIPIDSEHYSIFELLKHHKLTDVKKIYITASGGPFLNFKKKQFKNINPKDALKHPKWKMGKKISVDSATLMNKIFEFIEAQKLFNIPKKKLDILIHPNSLVHAIAVLKNGLTKFIYHDTSMLIPLANAIFEKKINVENFYKSKKKDFTNVLFFDSVNPKTFPAIKILNKINEFPSSPIIINAANEILVDQFLLKKVHFLDIIPFIMNILRDRNYKKYAIKNPTNINQIYKIDSWTKKLLLKKINNKYEKNFY